MLPVPPIKQIKVCHIAHGDLWAGAEVQLVTLLVALMRLPQFDLTVVLFNEGRLAEELRKAGLQVTVFREDRHNSLVLFLKLVTFLKRRRPDIVHTHKYKDNILGSVAAIVAGVPSVVRIIHGMTEPFHGMQYIKLTCYEFLDRAVTACKVRRIIAVSSNIQAALTTMYRIEKIVCIHNGIDLGKVQVTESRNQIRQSLGIGKEDYVVGTVGRMMPVKGQEFLLRAASLLKQKGHNIRYLFVGDGPLMVQLTKLARDLEIEKEVVLAGHRDEVYDLINCMDVFVLPSLHEGIPMVLLEALALSRPVVASRVGGIPEIILHASSGHLVEPAHVSELAEAIHAVLFDRAYARGLGEAGRRRIEEEFSAELMAQRTADLYASILGRDR